MQNEQLRLVIKYKDFHFELAIGKNPVIICSSFAKVAYILLYFFH